MLLLLTVLTLVLVSYIGYVAYAEVTAAEDSASGVAGADRVGGPRVPTRARTDSKVVGPASADGCLAQSDAGATADFAAQVARGWTALDDHQLTRLLRDSAR